MISVSAGFDGAGVLVFCKAEGHAGAGAKGGDIVCAAVSVLMRTAARVLAGREGIEAEFDAPGRGIFEFRARYDERGKSFLAAAGEFLYEGLASVAAEYPEYCAIHSVRTDVL